MHENHERKDISPAKLCQKASKTWQKILAKWQQSRAGKKGVVKLPKKNQQNKKKPK